MGGMGVELDSRVVAATLLLLLVSSALLLVCRRRSGSSEQNPYHVGGFASLLVPVVPVRLLKTCPRTKHPRSTTGRDMAATSRG